jgi:dTDP-4-amino-4,6-dideoxygalactose transaminase
MNQHARIEHTPIPFIDVAAQRRRLGPAIDAAIERVTTHCQFLGGPEVEQFEGDLAAFCGAGHAVSCASGTDALVLVLMAQRIGPGDAVLCPAFTFCATAEAVVLVGATPVFADVEPDTFNLDPYSLKRAVLTARARGLTPKAVIPVDLFGLPADHDAIAAVAAAEGLFVLDDAAQAFGATWNGRMLGTLAPATATSFFPAKPLGAYGDGGAVLTDDKDLADTLRSLRVHGQGTDKYDNVRIGMTSRLDTIQAAVLIEKLKIFREELAARERIAQRYTEGLRSLAMVPKVPDGATSVWAQYTIRLKAGGRDRLAGALKPQGIPTAIYYPKPLHRQEAYCRFPVVDNGIPITDRLAEEVISLPMHAYLDPVTQDRIIEAVGRALQS